MSYFTLTYHRSQWFDVAFHRYAKLDSSPAIAVARKQTGRNKESVLRSSALKAPFEIDVSTRGLMHLESHIDARLA